MLTFISIYITANVLGRVFLVKNKGNRRGNDPSTVRAKIENLSVATYLELKTVHSTVQGKLEIFLAVKNFHHFQVIVFFLAKSIRNGDI